MFIKRLLYVLVLLLPLSIAQAEITISTNKMEISKDCLKLEGDNVQIKSEDCQSGKFDKDKDDKENRSVNGDNNPGKGHDKDKKK